MAMAARRECGVFDPDTPLGESIFDHHIYVTPSDGDISEGVTSEASSIAGRQELGNLVVVYDDNQISIEDDTAIALSEDTAKRYESYGWHVRVVEGGEDIVAFQAAIDAAKAETTRPSLIQLRTVIGYPAPNLMNTGSVHGAAMGADEVAAVNRALGFDPEADFAVDDEVLAHTRKTAERGKRLHAAWSERFDTWAEANPRAKALLDRISARGLPEGWSECCPSFGAARPTSREATTR